jgi:hypothetical protein
MSLDQQTTQETPSSEATTKQKADACEMLVAAELTLTGGLPAFLVPAISLSS